MIRIEKVTHFYEGCEKPVLDDVSLDIREGEYVALVGPNGSGKTTLIRQLNALLIPEKGVVTVDGLATSDRANHKEIRRRVGMIFQHPDNQIVGMTVEEDVAFGPGNLGWPPEMIRARVDEVLESLGLAAFARRAPHTLSGGEKRLLSLAGVLVMNPRYIAFDEPSAYLDPAGRLRVRKMMGRLREEGIGVIHVTHDPEDMADADRLLVMDQGRIVLDGAPRTVLPAVLDQGLPGLFLPPVMDLLHRLHARGWTLPTDLVGVEDACREIHGCLVAAAKSGCSGCD
ncbi:MAG: ATP-binding cassette domain-containing protein [Deltaproteobacteria bacterium]|nr:ATP-binding cassette domain-containing protein [Deltaproteobacteria bacterium]